MRRSPSTLLSLCNSSALILCILIFSTLSFAASPDRITGPIVSGQLVKLSAGVPMRALPQHDQGPVDSSLKLSYMTLLTVPSASQREALDQLLAQQQDRNSPLYHQWLTPEQYADRFGLSPNDIQKLTTWLQSQGFSVHNVARGQNWIVFSGTDAQAEKTFQTEIHNFDVDGTARFSNTTPASIPAALSGVVTGIRGLSNFPAKSNLQRRKPSYTLPVTGGYQLFLAPGDIETIYDLGPLYAAGIDGTGQTLAVMGETDVYLNDLNYFRSGFGFSTIPTTGAGSCATDGSGLIIAPCTTTAVGAAFQYVLVGTDPGTPNSIQDDLSEADLDLEWTGATAPNAQIIYVNAPDPTGNGVWDSWYYAVDNKVSPVITLSYGNCELSEALTPGGQGTISPNEGTFASDEAELIKANAEGITFLNASGDSGAAGCDPNTATVATGGLAVNYPASSPEVTGVGGTATTISEISTDASTYWSLNNASNGDGGSALSYIPEAAWNDDFELGAYCAANPTSTSCTDYGITNAQTAQTASGLSSTGGGASNCTTINASGECTGGFAKPSWQTVTISGQASARFVPDVSLLASPGLPGYIFCTQLSELSGDTGTGSSCAPGGPTGIVNALNLFPVGSFVGGTSASAQVFGGMVVLLNQYLVKNGVQSAPGLGNINPNLYQIAIAKPSAFHKVTASDYPALNPGSNQVYCSAGTPPGQPKALQCPAAVAPATEGLFGYLSANADATTGYNLVTGLGSVDLNELATVWESSTTPSFTLSGSPSSLTITAGGAVGTSTITVTDVGGFTGNVSLAVLSGLPSGVTASFNPTSTATTSVLTLTASSSATAGGPTTVTITGTSGSLTANTTIALTVNASTTPGYSLSAGTANPTSVNPGSPSTATVTVTSANGYTGTVTLSCTISPVITGATAPTCGLSPNPVSVTTNGGSSTLTFTTVAASSDVQRSLSGTRNMASASPNVNPAAKPSRMKLQFFALWLPISGLTLVGFVFGSSATQRRRMRVLGLICLLSTALVLLPSCGGGSSSSSSGCLAVPAVPTGLAASGTTSSGTTLTWTASTAPANCSLTGYTVYQNGKAIATPTSATYNVTGLTAGTQYSFTVAANDSFGVSAQSSPPVSVPTTGSAGTPSGTYTISITGKDANNVTQTGSAATVTVTVN